VAASPEEVPGRIAERTPSSGLLQMLRAIDPIGLNLTSENVDPIIMAFSENHDARPNVRCGKAFGKTKCHSSMKPKRAMPRAELPSGRRTEARQHGGLLHPIRESRFVELVFFACVEYGRLATHCIRSN
jgi:hypothetical protein